MEVREITSTEGQDYFKLRVQSEIEYPEFVGFNAEKELESGADKIGEILSNYPSNGTIVFGGFRNNKLIGVTALSRRLSPKYLHKAFMWGMYVLPDFRGTNAAKLLMQTAIDWASNHPEVIAITLQVTLSNVRGQRFYKRFGFNIFGTESNAICASGEFHGVYYMELSTINN